MILDKEEQCQYEIAEMCNTNTQEQKIIVVYSIKSNLI